MTTEWYKVQVYVVPFAVSAYIENDRLVEASWHSDFFYMCDNAMQTFKMLKVILESRQWGEHKFLCVFHVWNHCDFCWRCWRFRMSVNQQNRWKISSCSMDHNKNYCHHHHQRASNTAWATWKNTICRQFHSHLRTWQNIHCCRPRDTTNKGIIAGRS